VLQVKPGRLEELRTDGNPSVKRGTRYCYRVGTLEMIIVDEQEVNSA
jgi:hypothetical protein